MINNNFKISNNMTTIKNFSTLTTVLLLFMVINLVSCTKENKDGENPKKEGELVGSITDTKSLDSTITYTITGPVIVEDGATLNIPAGTMIKAKKGFNNYILVLQGGKINVRGTADKPVTMTANISDAQPGHWGGLIINGRAPLAGGTIGSTEISSAFPYGGTKADDNSGTITYLTIEYPGARSSADVEHNGLTLNGVGNGTTIENIFIRYSADDGVEFFGGNVNVKNLLVVDSDDDMFDFTQGYTGKLENAYGIWQAGYTSTEADPRGIEADGNFDGNFPTHTGQSDFTVKNVTFDLRLAKSADVDVTNVKDKMLDVIKIRRGAKINVENALLKGTGTVVDLIDFTDGKGAGNPLSTISLTNSLVNTNLGKSINFNATQLYNGVNEFGTDVSKLKIEAGNTGCSNSIFTWTKYAF
jgi:hypothetical protein